MLLKRARRNKTRSTFGIVDSFNLWCYTKHVLTHREIIMAKVNKSFVTQQQMTAFKAQFKYPFTINDTIVDIEEMGANYPNELVPLVDIAQGIKILIQHKISNAVGNKYATHNLKCWAGEMVPADTVLTSWMFQRNSYCNNVANIVVNWFEPCARSGKGVRLPKKYGSIVLPADSGHTSIARIIRGETMLPFEITDIPDQGNFDLTLQLAIEVAGEIFLSLNSKNVKKPSKFDIFRIAVVQKQEPEFSIHTIASPLGFKFKQEATAGMTIHNLNDIHVLWKLDKTGDYLKTTLEWWVRNWPAETVDPCLSASFGMLMAREAERNKKLWTKKQQDSLAQQIKDKWNIVEFADDFIKEAYSEVTGGEGAHDSNHQVMYGLAYITNKYLKGSAVIPSSIDFNKATTRVL